MKKLLRLGFWVSILFILISLPAVYLNGRITIDDFKNYVLSFGLFAPLTFILATAVTNIIPPLAATVFWITGVILFGPFYGAVFSYIANLIGSTANYIIAYIWGRPAVAKLAGEGSLKEIDKYAKATKFWDLIMFKMFSGAASDYVSYAAGLAKVPFWVHFSAVGYGIVPMMGIGFYLIYRGTGGNLYAAASSLGIFYAINYSTTLFLVPLIYRLSTNSQNQTPSPTAKA
ncbi:MAG: DedA family protein [Microgenomates group bacterium GW2011_GWA1_Microgenomates_45_10]|nr:MAG: DedA family protein [Microgenomates group bacterium GW2011_GWA1_Microgenomates_45_10]